MVNAIKRLVRNIVGALLTPIRTTVRILTGLWHTFISFFHLIRGHWHAIWRNVWWAHRWINNYLGVNEFAHLVTRLKSIPQAVSRFWHWLEKWINKYVHAWVRFLKHLISTVEHALHKFISFVWDHLVSFSKWATRKIGELFSWVTKVGYRIADLVLHPEKLVTWFLPKLLGPLVRFLISRRSAIGRWFIRTAVSATAEFAHLAEDVIVRIF